MKTKHIFISVLDVSELIPFCLKKSETLMQSLKEQENVKKELEKFITKLEKNYKEKIWYLGMDVIAEKLYERFMFDKGGFLEIMVEAPLVINAHFVHEDQAKKFCKALKDTFSQILAKTSLTSIFLESIKVQSETDDTDGSMNVKKWNQLKKIRRG
ncbi:MAG: hypothetical protein KKF44_07425 [Nanoarchaeota archaeon]|nr:hypothetical protein [Nanoarchaeota archaeon]